MLKNCGRRASYADLRLTTLLERRMRGDLIETFKIINGFVNYGHKMFGTNTAYRTSRHPLRSAHDVFNNRVIKYWNQLPLHMDPHTTILHTTGRWRC